MDDNLHTLGYGARDHTALHDGKAFLKNFGVLVIHLGLHVEFYAIEPRKVLLLHAGHSGCAGDSVLLHATSKEGRAQRATPAVQAGCFQQGRRSTTPLIRAYGAKVRVYITQKGMPRTYAKTFARLFVLDHSASVLKKG